MYSAKRSIKITSGHILPKNIRVNPAGGQKTRVWKETKEALKRNDTSTKQMRESLKNIEI